MLYLVPELIWVLFGACNPMVCPNSGASGVDAQNLEIVWIDVSAVMFEARGQFMEVYYWTKGENGGSTTTDKDWGYRVRQLRKLHLCFGTVSHVLRKLYAVPHARWRQWGGGANGAVVPYSRSCPFFFFFLGAFVHWMLVLVPMIR